MKIAYTAVLVFLLSSTSVTSYRIPQSDLVARDVVAVDSFRAPDLEKRRGGGGGRGGGSGGSGGGRSGSGGSGSSSG